MSAIHVDPVLYAKILEEIRDSEFRTADEYVNFVLREVLDSPGTEMAADSSNDEAVIRSLQKLGYL